MERKNTLLMPWIIKKAMTNNTMYIVQDVCCTMHTFS